MPSSRLVHVLLARSLTPWTPKLQPGAPSGQRLAPRHTTCVYWGVTVFAAPRLRHGPFKVW